MKQQITKEQWEELEVCQMRKLYKVLGVALLNIGQMIEFLGDNWICEMGQLYNPVDLNPETLCDALWEAVKYKLSQ
jgi:hypothetical protein